MRDLSVRVLLAAALICGAIAPAWADYWDGKAAYKAGDYTTALKEWRPLAEQGDAGAQYNLGFMYDRGYGVPENDAEAEKWYRLAAEQGLAIAQSSLGRMYMGFGGVPKNNIEAHMWLSLAKAQGHERAPSELNTVKSRMTTDQIAEAQRLASEWWEENME